MSNTKTTRRSLLAGLPAAAAMVAPAAAIALPDPERSRRDEILERHLDVLSRLDDMPLEGRRKVLTAVTDAIETSMAEHSCDAELLALGPEFDEVFEDWWQRLEAGLSAEKRWRPSLSAAPG
jgi:hypothetical protein